MVDQSERIDQLNRQLASLLEVQANIQRDIHELKSRDNGGGSLFNHNSKKDEEIKLNELPDFDGDLEPDVYLDWERKIERIFKHKKASDSKRFSFAILKQ